MPGAIAKPSKKRGGPDPEHDAFLDAVQRLVTWAQENLQLVIGGGVLVVGLVVAGLWYASYQEGRTEQASRQLQGIRSALATGTDTVGIPRLQQFVQNYGGTDAGREGRVLLARLQLQRQSAGDAIETVRPVVDARPVDTPGGVAARRLLAEAQQAAGEPEAALETLRDLAENARFGFQRRQAAAERASILREMGRLSEAREIYRRLVEEAPDTEAGEIYAVRLGEVEAMMAAGGGASSGDASGDGSASAGGSGSAASGAGSGGDGEQAAAGG